MAGSFTWHSGVINDDWLFYQNAIMPKYSVIEVAIQTAALEAELQKGKALEQRAKRESDRLQTLLNHTLEGVITIDENGHYPEL